VNDIAMIKTEYASVNNWLIDSPSGSIIHVITGEKKRLGEYQLKMLEVLFENRGVILSREELTALVWEGRVIGNNSLPNAIHALRIALEDNGKQQRIIKTIPKKGYLLEAEYCRYFEENVQEDRENDQENEHERSEETMTAEKTAADRFQENDHSTVPPSAEASLSIACAEPEHCFPVPTSVTSDTRSVVWRKRFVLLVLVFICVACWWYFSIPRANQLRVVEVENGVYSNIQLHEVWQTREMQQRTGTLRNTLRNTFNNLNQQLRISSSRMQVYYSATDLTLNYTLYITNSCNQRQLSMAIRQWRSEPQQLNTLVLRETRRIINEMATCPAP